MKLIKLFNLAALIAVIVTAGCESSTKVWEDHERQQISDYLKTIPDSVVSLKPSGLYYIELQAGTGQTPVLNDTVYFNYKGTFLNGVAFDSVSTVTAPYKYVIGSLQIVAGVDEGLQYMKEGGKARLLTPSKLAYGRQGIFDIIPGYTPLLWDIELRSIKPGPGR